uniref:Uncharacterized protein n=1 Tax=Globodera rostochiensis TaxID=31243 RepID=A0A914HS02_GLORO
MKEAVVHLRNASNGLTEKCLNRDCLEQKRAYKSNFVHVQKHFADAKVLISGEINRWQAELEQHQQQMGKTNKQNTELRGETRRLRVRICRSSDEIRRLWVRTKQIAWRCDETRRLRSARDKAVAELEASKDAPQLRQRVAELEKQNGALAKDVAQLTETKEELKMLQANYRELVTDHSKCAGQILQLNKLSEMRNKQDTQKQLEYDQRCADMAKKISEQHKQYMAEQTKCYHAVLMEKNMKEQLDDLRDDYTKLEEKAQLSESMKVAELEQKLGTLEADKNALDENSQRLEQDLETSNAQRAQLETELAELEQKLSTSETDNDMLQLQNQQLAKEFETFNAQRVQLETELAELEQKLSTSETDNDMLQLQIQRLEKELKEQLSVPRYSSAMLHYQNETKQRINDIVVKKGALDQAVLLVNQKHKQQQQLLNAARTTAATQTEPVVAVPTTSTAAAAAATAAAEDEDEQRQQFQQRQCAQCPMLQQQLQKEMERNVRLRDSVQLYVKHSDDLAGAMNLLIAERKTAMEIAADDAGRAVTRDGAAASGGPPKRPRTD